MSTIIADFQLEHTRQDMTVLKHAASYSEYLRWANSGSKNVTAIDRTIHRDNVLLRAKLSSVYHKRIFDYLIGVTLEETDMVREWARDIVKTVEVIPLERLIPPRPTCLAAM